ncbi:MAG: hypothetical protein ABEJ99_03090 [Candidatus Nanohaloarchaea archaeon]
MARFFDALADLFESVVAFLVMMLLGIISFYFTVFVVKTGSAMAGYNPDGNFVVLSAALIVVATVLGSSYR